MKESSKWGGEETSSMKKVPEEWINPAPVKNTLFINRIHEVPSQANERGWYWSIANSLGCYGNT